MERAIVTAQAAPLYVAPDAQSELADEILHGMVVTLMAHAPGTGFVRARTAYDYEGFARETDLLMDNAAAATWEAEAQNVLRTAFTDVLAAPRIQAARLITLSRGGIFSVCGENKDGWTQVRLADGQTGFVRTVHRGHPRPVFDPADEVGFRRRVTETARSYLGTQYRWGGKTPEGIDCSGLCSMTYWLNDVNICRDARLAPGFPVHEIPREKMRPGDLLYFPGHIAMLLYGDHFIHATAVASCVCINSMNPDDADGRADLAQSLLAIGSIFGN